MTQLNNLWEEHNKALDTFCWCGLPAKRFVNANWYCLKHDRPKQDIQRKGRWSGKSKTPYGSYETR